MVDVAPTATSVTAATVRRSGPCVAPPWCRRAKGEKDIDTCTGRRRLMRYVSVLLSTTSAVAARSAASP